jgi:hypothetical protein
MPLPTRRRSHTASTPRRSGATQPLARNWLRVSHRAFLASLSDPGLAAPVAQRYVRRREFDLRLVESELRRASCAHDTVDGAPMPVVELRDPSRRIRAGEIVVTHPPRLRLVRPGAGAGIGRSRTPPVPDVVADAFYRQTDVVHERHEGVVGRASSTGTSLLAARFRVRRARRASRMWRARALLDEAVASAQVPGEVGQKRTGRRGAALRIGMSRQLAAVERLASASAPTPAHGSTPRRVEGELRRRGHVGAAHCARMGGHPQ